MTALRWLRGPILDIPGGWPRWTYLLGLAVGMNLLYALSWGPVQ